jgi:hypothetical protein
MNAVKCIILQRRHNQEITISPVAEYQFAKIINPQAQGSDVERDEFVLVNTKRFNTPSKGSTMSFVSSHMNSTPQTWNLVVLLCDCRTINEVTKAATSQKEGNMETFP